MRLRINNFLISVSFPAVALIALIVITNSYTAYLLCLTAVIIHELGHLTLMIILGLKPEGLEIRLFNIIIVLNNRYNVPVIKDILITIAGPLFNLIIFAVFIPFLKNFAYINLYIGLFNLLPASNLDGGQLLFLLLNRKYRYDKSVLISDIITIITAVLIFFFGILVLLQSRYNFSLLFIGLYIFLSVFIRKEKYL